MKAILIDDEQLALDFLENQLEKIGNIDIIGTFVNPIVGRKAILEQAVDVVFLDINLPEINGLELAETLLESKPELIVVFVTAHNKYAVEAFELNALDYVVKPINQERLAKTLKRIESDLTKQVKEPLLNDPQLHVHLCNYLSFEDETGKLEQIPWRTAKARELFLYLLQNNNQHVQKSTLIELLWPTFEQEKALAQLYTMVYHIRKTLQQFGNHFQLKNITESYLLTIHHVKIDVREWEESLLSVPTLSVETIDTYNDIMERYTGPYLEKYDYLWAEPERHRLEQLWIRSAYQIANFYFTNDNHEKAIAWYTKIYNIDFGAEEAHFSLMKIYADLKSDLLVQQQYYLLLEALEEDLGVLPSKDVTEWYKNWEKNIIKA